MPKNMLIHDTRVVGSTPSSLAQNNYIVDGSTSTAHIFEWADYYAHSQGGLDNLYILCHGNSAILYLGDKFIDTDKSFYFSILAGDVKKISSWHVWSRQAPMVLFSAAKYHKHQKQL